jgi:hypothetical protein
MASSLVRAEPQRPLLTKENKFPDVQAVDVGFRFEYAETGEDDFTGESTSVYNYAPLLRYRPFEPLTLSASVPFHTVSPEEGASDSGLGNVVIGAELLAYEDIFDYPWVIPYAAYVFDTESGDVPFIGDRDGLRLGLAIGSKAWRTWTFVADGRITVSADEDEVGSLGGSIVWDVSEAFGVLVEMRTFSEKLDGESGRPSLWLGALTYKVNSDLTIIGRGGGGTNGAEETLLALEAHYSL